MLIPNNTLKKPHAGEAYFLPFFFAHRSGELTAEEGGGQGLVMQRERGFLLFFLFPSLLFYLSLIAPYFFSTFFFFFSFLFFFPLFFFTLSLPFFFPLFFFLFFSLSLLPSPSSLLSFLSSSLVFFFFSIPFSSFYLTFPPFQKVNNTYPLFVVEKRIGSSARARRAPTRRFPTPPFAPGHHVRHMTPSRRRQTDYLTARTLISSFRSICCRFPRPDR
jgi:hypothetical protein